MAPNIDSLLQSLTLEEKVSLLAGRDFWETVPVSSKGIPAIKSTSHKPTNPSLLTSSLYLTTSDGPNGARGAVFTGGTRAACFPAAVCSASTWDPSLSRRFGNALAEETITKGARVLLGPTMCIHRHPLGGRNFESFSEDPLLTGKLAAQVVKGLQEKRVAATIKHFAANEQETERLSVDEIISERALREIYLKPFEIAIREANPWAVMTAYNKVNGTHCDSHPLLLKKVLRGKWGWKGLIMSDWGGVNSTVESLDSGLDLEMPGPTKWRSSKVVSKAVEQGLLSESAVTDRARNVLELIQKVGGFENPTIPPEQSTDKPEHRQLIRDIAGQGLVLLKNANNTLPLTKEKTSGKKIALLGFAKEALIHGGGSASLHAHYKISPWEGLHAAFTDDVELHFAKGAHTYRQLPPLGSNCTGVNGEPGWTVELFEQGQKQRPIHTDYGRKESVFSPLLDSSAKWKDVRMSATFVPTQTGAHYLGCSGIGPTLVYINGEPIFEQENDCEDAMGFLFGGIPEKEFTYLFTKDQSYDICITSSPPTGGDHHAGILSGIPGFRLGFMYHEQHDEDLLSEAAEIARMCDFAVVFTGHTPVWETEGQDQLSFNLPKDGSQDKLVSAVASANSRTIVVNSTGVAVAMPWLSEVAAVVQAWYPGQEAGNAISDILTGTVNPSGRLPISWPKRIEDTPAYGNFPGVKKGGQLTVRYKEGVFVGYRHYDRLAKANVQFPFGFGLSYTSFKLKDASVTQEASGTFETAISVVNSGQRSGATVVQLYVGAARISADHPIKSLASFKKVFLEVGEEKTVTLSISLKDFAYYDEGSSSWKVDRGKYDFSFGQSAASIEQCVSVDVEGSCQL
ncbi:glycoside hydrolase family 3 protein [Lophiostoma macrostomum CBS 122681]|uniref:beta-glucosidase n=1 Tax=Lophiostoma macrostomum CBS 122681 TaxID=1314788 RepID=A0A6A6TEQ4_9PLEO|nr:glycoside hydrolase family 3 protein [Lophiostoma macrostomum CBS 122681]